MQTSIGDPLDNDESRSEMMKRFWQDPVRKTKMLNRKNVIAERKKELMESGTIPCQKCGKDKGADEFPKTRTTRYGSPRYGYCKDCHCEYQRANRYRLLFNISVEDYNKIAEFQSGLCAICLQPPKNRRLSVDHDHKTGLIRGALCSFCNRAIGLFRDDIKKFERVVEYLKSPPATSALGAERYGLKGRVKNKKSTRRKLNGIIERPKPQTK